MWEAVSDLDASNCLPPKSSKNPYTACTFGALNSNVSPVGISVARREMVAEVVKIVFTGGLDYCLRWRSFFDNLEKKGGGKWKKIHNVPAMARLLKTCLFL